MARDMEAIIRISGNLDKSLRDAIERAAQQIESLGDITDRTTRAFDAMSDTIDLQSDALKKAKKQYASYVLNGEKGSAQAKELAKKIKQLSGEINDNRSRMQAAENAADALAGELDDVGDAARETDGGFTIMKGAIANLVASGIQSLISGCANAVSSIYGLADSTREFRQDMNTLTTAYDQAGFSTEQATETWKDLYAIFGEDDRAVEAANNIARMADSQKELDQWTRITTGVWGTYQDALPVESLAEAASEKINTGPVTGALADALNWSSDAAQMFSKYMSEDVTTAEDAFNVALSKCTTEVERNALVTDTLTKLYGDAADTYNETAGSIIEANKANADYTLTLAEMGERIEPVTTAVKNGMVGLLGSALDLMDNVDMEAFSGTIVAGFEKVSEVISPIVANLIPALAKVFGTVMGALSPLAGLVSDFASTILPVLTDAVYDIFDAISPVIPVIAEMVGNLLPLISSLIEALAPIVTTLFQAITPVVSALGQIISQLIPPLIELINMLAPVLQFLASIFRDVVGGAINYILPIIQSLINAFSGIISFLQNVFMGNWTAVWEGVKSIFSTIFESLAAIIKAPINTIISIVNGVIDAINSVGFDVPDWVPIIGGASFRLNIPKIPMLANGGFTDGVSIAGEAGTEAVISFNRSVREANLGYWAQAGRMLGATAEDAGFELSGEPGGGTVIDMGGVTFAPNITFSGKADKENVIKAIEDEYPEFLDMLENWLIERGATVYA